MNTTAPIDLAVEHPDGFTIDYEGSPTHFLSTTSASAPIDIAVEHPMAINVATYSVEGSESSYVVQGMEIRLALKDMMNDDTIRLVHTFSCLVFPRVGLALDLDSLAKRLGEIQWEFCTDIQSRDRVPSHGCGQAQTVTHRGTFACGFAKRVGTPGCRRGIITRHGSEVREEQPRVVFERRILAS